MPRLAHARRSHHATDVHMYVWKQGALLFPRFPPAAPCTAAVARFTRKSHELRRKLSLSFSFSLYLPAVSQQVELCIVHYRAAKDSRTLFAIRRVSRPKKMTAVACITALSCHPGPSARIRNLLRFAKLSSSRPEPRENRFLSPPWGERRGFHVSFFLVCTSEIFISRNAT